MVTNQFLAKYLEYVINRSNLHESCKDLRVQDCEDFRQQWIYNLYTCCEMYYPSCKNFTF